MREGQPSLITTENKMTHPTQSVRVRRADYAARWAATPTGSIAPVNYDDQMDSQIGTDVLDTVLAYNPAWVIYGYHWEVGRNKQIAD